MIGCNIRERRGRLSLTQNELAASAGLGRTYLGGIEKGRRNPSLLVLVRLAAVLGVELPDLLKPISRRTGPDPVEALCDFDRR